MKITRKIITRFVATAAILTLAIFGVQFQPVLAATSEVKLYTSPASVSVVKGGTTTLQLRLNKVSNEKVNYVSVYVAFPASRLEVTGVSKTGSAFNGDSGLRVAYNNTNGSLSLVGSGSALSSSADVLIASVTFRTKTDGRADVSFTSQSQAGNLLGGGNVKNALDTMLGGVVTVYTPVPIQKQAPTPLPSPTLPTAPVVTTPVSTPETTTPVTTPPASTEATAGADQPTASEKVIDSEVYIPQADAATDYDDQIVTGSEEDAVKPNSTYYMMVGATAAVSLGAGAWWLWPRRGRIVTPPDELEALEEVSDIVPEDLGELENIEEISEGNAEQIVENSDTLTVSGAEDAAVADIVASVSSGEAGDTLSVSEEPALDTTQPNITSSVASLSAPRSVLGYTHNERRIGIEHSAHRRAPEGVQVPPRHDPSSS